MPARRSVRLRLTALYSTLFLVAGAVLLATTYVLVAHGPLPGSPSPPDIDTPTIELPPVEPLASPPVEDLPAADQDGRAAASPAAPPSVTVPSAPDIDAWAESRLDAQRADHLRRLVVGSLVALGLMAVASAALGWTMAGRALRPLATMTATVRHIYADNLDRRLHAAGPDDELKDLADTFDQLLERLDRAFESQRRFVAHASHELRTPLTLERTVLELAATDEDATVESLRAACRQALASTEHQHRLLDALLALARSQRGPDRTAPVDLADVAGHALSDRADGATSRGLRVTATLGPAPLAADPHLMESLVANLVDNAIAHNVPHGWVEVTTHSSAPEAAPGRTGPPSGTVTLRVTNGGPVIPDDRVDDLLQPFRRHAANGERPTGLGLGLPIVTAIATTHGGQVRALARPEGGLDVQVTLPATSPPPPGAPDSGPEPADHVATGTATT